MAHHDGARVLAGDVDAYAELVARHRARCLRYADRVLCDADEAEDVTQEAFVRAYRSLSRCQDPGRFGGWLFSILVNRCRTAGAKRARRERVFRSEGGDVDMALVADADQSSEMAAPSLEQIQSALRELNTLHREAFVLKYVEEMNYEDMAALTGATVSALKMRVSRAREILRAQLAEVCDD